MNSASICAELRDVTFHTGQVLLFEKLNLSLAKDRCTVLMGPAGCGKSTILKIVAGLILPQAGSVIFDQKPWDARNEDQAIAVRSKTGFVFQNAALWANKTVRQNIELPLQFHNPQYSRAQVEERVREAARLVGLRDVWDDRPSHLSLGEQKLVSFARAIVNNPETLFLDDPTAGLDNQLKERLLAFIEDFRRQGKTVILVTQDPSVTARVADELAIMRDGQLLAFGPINDVVRSQDPRVTEILTSVLSQAATFSQDILGLLSEGQP